MTRPNRNLFDLTHDVKLSFNMGELIPILALDCVPGDKVMISGESLLRFQPLLAPMMHRCDVTMHFFFVPNRIVWPGWEDYITNTKTAGELPAFPFIRIKADGTNYTRQMDYMGLPVPDDITSPDTDEDVSAIPFAAFNKVFNEYYRDQNLVASIVDTLVNGNNEANIAALTAVRKRAWEHDYFTSALPFAQKGDAVDLPIGTFNDVPVNFNAPFDPGVDESRQWDATEEPGGTPTTIGIINDPTTDVLDNVYARTSELQPEATTINDLRRAFRLQEWLEKMARGGSRLIEVIRAHFGVNSSDKRLQRPEYITGTKSPVVISEVLNTTGTEEAPQGNMAGHGLSVTTGKFGSYYVEEHGYVIGIMSVMPKTCYQQGIPKHFTKITDPTEFYWPSFAHIGEQPVLNKELYAYKATGADTFGYLPRYTEYKYMPSRVCGEFRLSLNYWHMGRIFAGQPALNQAFIESDPTHRVFAVTDETEQKMLAHVLNKIKVIRPMPKFGTPTF